jgi:5-methylcytosine-specific restriction endonuclease McrA
MEKVLVLKNDMSILGTCHWQDAVCMVVSGKAEVLVEGEKRIHPTMLMPLAIRLIKAIRNLWGVKVPWTKSNVHARDQYVCQYCGIELKRNKATIDHVIPRTQGGKNSWENTVCSCFDCNNKKNDRTPREAGMYLKKEPYRPTIMEFLMRRIKNDGLEELVRELGIY